MISTPIALFTYNRPEHTKRALLSLAQCSRLHECSLHIFCDGPRLAQHQPAVMASRRIVNDFALRFQTQVVERAENLGLARSIVSGVTSLVREYGRIIVLEDDLVLNPDFVDYMLQALDRYQD